MSTPVPEAWVSYIRPQKWYVRQGRLWDGPFSAEQAREYARVVNGTLHLQDPVAFLDMERRHPGLPKIFMEDVGG